MKHIFLLLSFCFIGFLFGFGQEVEIGVYRGSSIQQINFYFEKGSYLVKGDRSILGTILPNEFVSIERVGKQIQLKKSGRNLGYFKRVHLIPMKKQSSLQLRPRKPEGKRRKYKDAFLIFSDGNALTVVNQVLMVNYLCGVLESEAGGGRPIEYYKAQAVISRTYALRHIHRHKDEGFDLCDQVHCQAYYHELYYTDEIRDAVFATKGIYVVDTLTGKPIQGFFSANCGGETSCADDVWNNEIAYLQPFVDTFCVHTFQAKWTKKIPKWKWKIFLLDNYFFPIDNPFWSQQIYSFQQPHRLAFYLDPSLGIPLRDIRYHFHLKSTFFSCFPQGDYVVLNGRGFGHGVGLCQEGAMNMAKQGFNYQQILAFYFTGITFKQLYELDFFNQSPVSPIQF